MPNALRPAWTPAKGEVHGVGDLLTTGTGMDIGFEYAFVALRLL